MGISCIGIDGYIMYRYGCLAVHNNLDSHCGLPRTRVVVGEGIFNWARCAQLQVLKTALLYAYPSSSLNYVNAF